MLPRSGGGDGLGIRVVGALTAAQLHLARDWSGEHQLKQFILRHYDSTTRPVRSDKTPVKVQISISLYHILDTRWTDEYLRWNISDFDDVTNIRIPSDQIWTPDLVIQNFAGDKFNDYMVTNAIVSSDGTVLWMYPALIKTYCTLNVKYFPFDSQDCDIQFISWTHNGEQLDIFHNNTMKIAVYYASANQEWSVNKEDGISAKRNEKKYACCPELYPDVTFTIHMRRGSLFYVINLIAPCFLIFIISFLGFFLPVESGEKVNLEITILLALVVFLLRVGETMPPTPDSIPILGMFFASTMLMVSIALVMAVIVTNIYAKKNTTQRCPAWAVNLASRFFPNYSLPERESNACIVSLASGKDPELQSMYPQRQTPPTRPRHSTNAASATVRRGTSPSGRGVGQRGPETGIGGAAERRARRMQRTAASVSTDSTMYPRQNSEEGSIRIGG